MTRQTEGRTAERKGIVGDFQVRREGEGSAAEGPSIKYVHTEGDRVYPKADLVREVAWIKY